MSSRPEAEGDDSIEDLGLEAAPYRQSRKEARPRELKRAGACPWRNGHPPGAGRSLGCAVIPNTA
jgi:hypothetical protein